MLTKSNAPSGNDQQPSRQLMLRLARLTLVLTVLAASDIGYSVWARVALGQAVSEGARFAIVGPSFDHGSPVESIRRVVLQNSFGLLDEADDSQIGVRYSIDNSGVTMVHVDARASRQTPLAAIPGTAYPIDVAARRSDVVDRMGVPNLAETRELHASEQPRGNIALLGSWPERVNH